MAIRGNETRPKLITPLPGPNAKKIVKKDSKYLMTTTKCAPVAAARARGVVVEDVDGNRLLDFASGIGVINTGHCHPKVVKAVQDQAAKLMHFAGTDYYYDVQADLAERLNSLVPIKGNTKTFFCQSGAEANEAAFKVARNHAGKRQFVAFQGAFHGRTMGALSLTHSKAMQQMGNFPSMPGVHHTPFPSAYKNMWGINGYEEPDELSNRALDALEYLFETKLPVEDTAALFWEPVQGEGGYHVTPKPFAKGLQKICNDNDILLVADEVQTGFGRTGKWFASEHFGVNPDMISIAKAMGSGMPIGAQIVRADLDLPAQGIHSNTYGGNLVACASSLATIDVLDEEKLIENSAKMGDYLGKHLADIKEDFQSVGDARGIGLMRAMEFNKADGAPDAKLRDKVEEQAWKKGLVLLGCGKSGIRFIPSLNVTKGQIDGAMDVLRDAMRAAKA